MKRRAVWCRDHHGAKRSGATLAGSWQSDGEVACRTCCDIGDVPALDVWGDTVQARVVVGTNASLALVELAPGALVPGAPPRARAARHVRRGQRSPSRSTGSGASSVRAGRGGSRRTCRMTRWPVRTARSSSTSSPRSEPTGMPSPAPSPARPAGRDRLAERNAAHHGGGPPGACRNAVRGSCSATGSRGGRIGRGRRSVRPYCLTRSRTWLRTGSRLAFAT